MSFMFTTIALNTACHKGGAQKCWLTEGMSERVPSHGVCFLIDSWGGADSSLKQWQEVRSERKRERATSAELWVIWVEKKTQILILNPSLTTLAQWPWENHWFLWASAFSSIKEIVRLNFTGFEGTDKDHPNEDKQAVYSELAIAKGSAPITCIW